MRHPFPSLLPLAAAMLLSACTSPQAEEVETEPTERVVPVTTERAHTASVDVPVEGTGTIGPWRAVLLSSEGSGRVVEVRARLGDVVAKGDVLARLDGRVPEAQLQQARANVRGAEAQLELAEASFAQADALLQQSATSSTSHLAARTGLDGARAQLDAARAAVDLAETAVANTRIRAPWAGTVSAVRIEEGALIGPGTPAYRLVDTSTVKISVGVPATDIAWIAVGQPVRVVVPGLGDDAQFEGQLAYVGPEPDPLTRTWPAQVELPNPDGDLRAGQVARVQIVVGVRDDAVVIPDDAVTGDDQPVVYVAEGDVARARTVVLGRPLGDLIEVRSGVQAGEEVVTLGRQHLSEGTPISRYQMGGAAEPSGSTPAAAADSGDSTSKPIE